ncbi:MAG: hypothetical protein GAK39_03202 [Variovorax sp.]|nr:MAG: hypothetical protein GAK39_03202 [Variovorax sp.]
MKWIHYTAPGAAASSYGVLEDDRVRAVNGSPFGGHDFTGAVHRLADVRIEVPLLPRTFYAAGLNYVRHIKEYAERSGQTLAIPEKADIGYRAVNALVPHEAAVVIPSNAKQVEYEGELVVVIGQKARHLSEADALSCVLGYTIGNDVSERLWQASDRTFWRAKNSDTFKPMGPWIETDFDLDAARTTVRVNGAGGPTDILARVFAQDIGTALGQSAIVENKPGANGNIATEYVQRAAPDGYTLVVNTISHNVNPLLQPERVKYDPVKDFTPVSMVAVLPQLIVVAGDSPYKTLGDLVKKAQSGPSAVSYGTAGVGGSAHLAAALLE